MDLIWKAILFGVVEGLTEFLPISSTGHLILVGEFVRLPCPFQTTFEVVIQLGAILAVVFYFFRRLFPWSGGPEDRRAVRNLWGRAGVAVLPAAALALAFGDWIETHLFQPWIVALALVAGGVALIVLERRHRPPRVTALPDLTWPVALGIGWIQCLAMIPGTSRSAATIIGAMLLGCSRLVAAEFSFVLAVPTMALASAYALTKADLASWSAAEWTALATGFAVSFAVAWGVVAFLMRFIQRRDFRPFGWYRIVLGGLVLAWFASR